MSQIACSMSLSSYCFLFLWLIGETESMSPVILVKMWNFMFQETSPPCKQIHTAHAQRTLANLKVILKRKKECACKTQLHALFCFNCNVILKFCCLFPATSSYEQLLRSPPVPMWYPAFQEFSTSKGSKRKIIRSLCGIRISIVLWLPLLIKRL